MLCTLVFQPFGTRVTLQEGKTLLQAAQEAGVHIPAYCGGEKSCGKCKIKLVEGNFEQYQITSCAGHLSPLTAEEKILLSESERQSGYRLACMTQVQGDVVLEVPHESRLQPQVILEAGEVREIPLEPAVKTYYLELGTATLKDNRDDFTRVKEALSVYKELDENLTIDVEALRMLSPAIRTGGWRITVYILYGRQIIGVSPGRIRTYYGAAADIGTTTVVVYLYDLSTGKLLQTGSFINPQVRYGDDVISRISYCMANKNGVKILQELLVDELNKTLQELAAAEGFSSEEICEQVLVFNTVMACIALGFSPEALGVSPFISPIAQALDIPARELGIRIMPGGNVHCLPSEAGFIGADNAAVLIAEGPHKQDRMKLIIDIGTNSEICLGNREKLYSTSCATGPALEGAQIKCGMRAAKGAIEAVKINPVTLEPELKVIGTEGTVPVGICGSGIIDVIAQMAVTGIIEPDGRFSSNAESQRIRLGDKGKKEYVLYFGKTQEERDIVVTMADVRAVQLAKAALYAGAKTLMQRCEIAVVDEVVLAGAFGSYINQENALNLGLFPDCSYKNIKISGNAAGAGAQMALCNSDKRREAEAVVRRVEFVETAMREDFAKSFSQAMVIPHKHDPFPINKPMAFSCPGIHNGKGEACAYPLSSPDELLNKEVLLKSLLVTALAENSRKSLPEGMIDLPGPFAALGYMVSPVSLYTFGKKHSEMLEAVLSLILNELSAYAKAAIDHGVKIISYADPAGDMEYVGERFYKQFSGKYNRLFFGQIEPQLKEALIHVCGKTSYSMEKAGYLLARPYRVDASKKYRDILFEETKNSKVKFLGHHCINQERLREPIIYRLEMI
ncbi:ASKHA domain-containing protein [Dehalobacter sp. DCM]|uniref:ASKHA domain-containing protein n=1 Tax=Dehalobacter sp. DCM TaxID=2907827 RepID=UPI003081E393|nr:ASKHA domain-containing protein [Dehalobacter sp. DCM]